MRPRLDAQHAGPNDATYRTGSKMPATIHSQADFFRPSFISGLYHRRATVGRPVRAAAMAQCSKGFYPVRSRDRPAFVMAGDRERAG